MKKVMISAAVAGLVFAVSGDIIEVQSTNNVETGTWVGNVAALTNALITCKAGDTIVLAKGVYDLTPPDGDWAAAQMDTGTYYGPSMLLLDKNDVTLKGATGNAEDVVIKTTEAVCRILRISGKRSSVRDLHLSGGYATGGSYNQNNGGALQFTETSEFASNCIFSACSAKRLGGAVGIWGNSGVGGAVYDSVFRGNNGTGSSLVASQTVLRGCIITNNVSSDTGYSQPLTSNCRLYDCLVADNVTTRCGIEDGFAEGCRFINNYARGNNYSNPGGGAARNAALTNCYFYGNRCYRLGGAIRGGTVVGCTVVSNGVINAGDSYGAGIFEAKLVENSTIISNMCGRGAGLSSCAMVTNCYIAYNSAAASGGGAYASVLVGCTVEHNVAPGYDNSNYGGSGGGLYGGSATNCVFRDNSCSATYCSTNVYNCDIFDTSMHAHFIEKCRIANCRNAPIPRAIGAVGYPEGHTTSNLYMIGVREMRNCLITNCYWQSLPGHFVNSAMFHAGVATNKCVENCTIAGNYYYILARNVGSAVYPTAFVNCAIIGNTGADIKLMDEGCEVFSNCVYATTAWSPWGRTFKNENFADGVNWQLGSVQKARFCGAGDQPYYALKFGSPLRGKGLVLGWMAGGEDIEGNPRLRDGLADVGAYQCWSNPEATLILIR